ncbi:hypothetical protein [Rossellomorea aquimaris]|uniref:hypothetical protein n=1 Tax=Rossellomorea aquimaris TaxID=189382 RepID=UPI001653DE44|nr:hypothetical protein [Rossellomorea aquimaris]
MFQREKKAVFPFILVGLFDPEELGAATGLNKKWKRPELLRQANVPKRKKGGFSFYSLRVI